MGVEAGQALLHYRLIEKIGQGGMGEVWKAEDTKLHRAIALKVLPEKMAADPDRRARFEREARAIASLNHPNIVTLHSVEETETETGTVHFITMELVAGHSLTELLPAKGFPLERVLAIAVPLTDAVSRAHRAGITHRDLKPDNVMIDDEGRLRVLDFGLAKLQDATPDARNTQMATVTSDTVEGRVLGTVSYMSPEQAEGKTVDARSDIFSLGTMLYEMTSGKRPFTGDTTMSTIGAILKDEPTAITELQPGLPRHMGRIVRRCLAKDPDRRYQTALDLRTELEELRVEVQSGAYEAAPNVETTRPSPSAMPWLIGIAAILIVLALMATSPWDRSDPPSSSFIHQPITATNAWDTGVSWSPDERFLAFDRMIHGNTDIYVQPLDGGPAVARVVLPGDQGPARWSPDGTLLAYISNEPGSPVYVVPPDGGEPQELTATNMPALLGEQDALLGDRPWSGDSASLLFSRFGEGRQVAVHRVDLETGETTQVTFPPPGSEDSGATHSFDHNQVAFRRGPIGSFGRHAVLVQPADGGEPEVVYEGSDVVKIGWRPDNRHIVIQHERSLAEVDVATRAVRELTSWPRRVQGLAISASGRIAYADFWHDQFLYVVDVETRERKQITTHARNNGGARFSPDGRTIAYSTNRNAAHEIWLHHRDGRPETRLTDESGKDTQPDWSPDGTRLVFRSDRDDGVPKLFVTSADGAGGVRLLVDQPLLGGMSIGTVSLHRWSPDDRLISYLFVGDEGPELWTVRPDGRDARKRLDGAREFDWYLDSRRGLVARDRGSETELSAVDLETGRENTLFVGALREIEVSPDGRLVAFCFGRGHFSMGIAVLQLELPSDPDGLPTAIGEPRYVVPTEGTWHVHIGGWSPDSKSIVYTHDQDYGDIYELVEVSE